MAALRNVNGLASCRHAENSLQSLNVTMPHFGLLSRQQNEPTLLTLISQRREGQFRKYTLNTRGIRDTSEWLEFYRRFWSESFERLDTHLKTKLSKKEKSHGKRGRN